MATTLTAGSTATISLDAFDSLTLVVTGKATLDFTSQAADLHSDFSVSNAQSKTYGPYGTPMSVLVTAVDQSMTYQKGSASPGRSFTTANAEILQIGTTTQGSGKEIVNITRLDTNADAVSRPVMVYMDHAVNPAAAPGSTTDFHGLDVKTYGSSANINANTRFYCIEGKANMQKTSGTALRGVGLMGSVVNSGAGGTLTLGCGVQTDVQNTSSGTMTEGVGLYVPSGVSSGGGAITTLYGIKIENQAAGGTNYAIKTGTGLVSFGDDVQFTTRTPASAAAAGTAGTITWDSGFLYVATAANTWKRVAIATW